MKSRKWLSQICVCLLVTTTSLCFAPFAYSAPLPGAALESHVGRYLLGETAPGLELMTRVLGRGVSADDIDEFLLQLRRTHPNEASDLETRMVRIREELHRAQTQRNGGHEGPESNSLSADERLILREVATREIRIDERLPTTDPQVGEIDFTGADHPTTSRAQRTTFLSVEERDTLRLAETPGEQAPPIIQERAERGLRKWYSDAQACMQARPQEAVRAAELQYMAQQMAISGGVTAAGYFVHTGISHFDLGGFGVDLLMSLISTGVSNKWMRSTDGFQVRWLKVFVWGHLRTDLDAEIYQISPWTDTHGAPMAQVVAERRAFNYWWNDRTSWISPLIYTIVNGVECLMNESQGAAAAARFSRGAFIGRTALSVGTSVLFYKVRAGHAPAAAAH